MSVAIRPDSEVRDDVVPLIKGLSQRASGAHWRTRLDPGQLPWQIMAATLVVAYTASTFLVRRPADGYSSLWDGWVYNTASLLPVIPVMIRVRRKPTLRLAWIALAAGIVLNAAGNLDYLFHDQNLNPIPNPASSSIPFLLSYVGFIICVAIMTQRAFGRVFSSVRLDGAITGLTVAAVAAALWFDPVLKISGRPLQVAAGMAFPLFDLVLLVLLVAGLAPQRYRPTWTTGLLDGRRGVVRDRRCRLSRSVGGGHVCARNPSGRLLGHRHLPDGSGCGDSGRSPHTVAKRPDRVAHGSGVRTNLLRAGVGCRSRLLAVLPRPYGCAHLRHGGTCCCDCPDDTYISRAKTGSGELSLPPGRTN